MKLSHVIAAVITLMLMTELLVGADGGVLTNLQQNAAPAAAQTPPGAVPTASVTSAPVRANPWNSSEDETWIDKVDPVKAEAQPSDAANDPGGQGITPPQPPHSAPLPPEIPHVPLPKPRLTAAGPQINYAALEER